MQILLKESIFRDPERSTQKCCRPRGQEQVEEWDKKELLPPPPLGLSFCVLYTFSYFTTAYMYKYLIYVYVDVYIWLQGSLYIDRYMVAYTYICCSKNREMVWDLLCSNFNLARVNQMFERWVRGKGNGVKGNNRSSSDLATWAWRTCACGVCCWCRWPAMEVCSCPAAMARYIGYLYVNLIHNHLIISKHKPF